MKIVVTGKEGPGSFKIRGEQLGAALGASIKPSARPQDVEDADIVIVVKRMPPLLHDYLIKSRKKWVYDCVDFYPQPTACGWTAPQASEWIKSQLARLDPDAIIWPTIRMANDCDIDVPGMILPHHHRPDIDRNEIRESIKIVGYEGNPKYLGEWRSILEQECEKRGWRFSVNPASLADLDVVVAFRGGQWSGYVPRHYKSNVKLANAHGSGTPFIGQQECGYFETACGAEYWAENVHELRTSFDWMESESSRKEISRRFLANAYTVNHAAFDLKAFLLGL